MIIIRQTATKYLEILVDNQLLTKTKLGKANYFINHQLLGLFTG